MIKDYDKFLTYLRKTGRLKLLPRVLRELQVAELRAEKLAPRTESAKEHKTLVSGSRTIQNHLLTDTTGKRVLLDIYKHIMS